MKRLLAMGITGMILLTGCAYNPKIDTRGRSGTHDSDQARNITNDVNHCRTVAGAMTNRAWDEYKQLTNLYFTTVTLGIVPLREKTYVRRVKQCLRGRGHSVID